MCFCNLVLGCLWADFKLGFGLTDLELLSNWSFCLCLSAQPFSPPPGRACSASCLRLSPDHPTMSLQPLLLGLTLNIVLLAQQSDFLLCSKCGLNSIKYENLYYWDKWARGFPDLLHLVTEIFLLIFFLHSLNFLAPNLSPLRNVCSVGFDTELLDWHTKRSISNSLVDYQFRVTPSSTLMGSTLESARRAEMEKVWSYTGRDLFLLSLSLFIIFRSFFPFCPSYFDSPLALFPSFFLFPCG